MTTKIDCRLLSSNPLEGLFQPLDPIDRLTPQSTITIPSFEGFNAHFSPCFPYPLHTADDPAVIDNE